MKFKYKGLEASGKIICGHVEAGSRKKAMQSLICDGIAVLALNEMLDKVPLKLAFLRENERLKFSDGEMCHFFDKLAYLCGGGLLLPDAIESIARNTSSAKEQSLSCRILEHLRDGDNFTQAIKKCYSFLDNSMLSMLELGDLTGKFTRSLRSIVDLLRRKIETKKRFMAGLSYPIFICCVAFVVILVFLFYLMPKMTTMMHGFGGKLPKMASILVHCSQGVAHYFPTFLLLLGIAGIWVRYLYKCDRYKFILDKIFIKIPIIGHLYVLFIRMRISSILSELISSGVSVSEAITAVAGTISNSFFRKNYAEARDAILDGMSLASAFKIHGVFDGSATDIIAVGEKIGDVASHFASLATMYDVQLDTFLKKVITLTSSVALLFAFTIVAILSLSIVSSVLNFNAKLMH
ncbi:MAG: type II secretion system F family protein [Puniceicoccales bacterium]|nr:type II secretion system F family protein [Puniceicoccales bacterium]